MKKRTGILPLLIFTMFVYSCRKSSECDCVKGTGEMTKEVRTPVAFSEIWVWNEVNAVVRQDTFFSVVVEGGENLVPFVTTEVVSNRLFIRNRNHCSWMRSYRKQKVTVFVSAPVIVKINNNGTGDIRGEGVITAPEFTLNVWSSGSINVFLNCGTSHCNLHTGVGDITMKGYSGVSYIYNAGSGFAYCGDLQSGYTFITSRGTGDSYVNVSKELDAGILWVGDVYYSGSPPVIKENISGKGRLFQSD